LTLRECPSCKIEARENKNGRNWGDCTGYEGYELKDIIPCKAQVIYLLRSDYEILGGNTPGSRHGRPNAAFVSISDLRAEFEARLSRTGRDGETLFHEVRNLGVFQYKDLSQAAKDAVNYICGSKRKRLLYSRWLAQRVRRKKGVVNEKDS